MIIGNHMLNGFKTIEITEIDVYGEKEYNFKFYAGDILVRDTTTDDLQRFLKHLSEEYYFEKDGEEYIIK